MWGRYSRVFRGMCSKAFRVAWFSTPSEANQSEFEDSRVFRNCISLIARHGVIVHAATRFEAKRSNILGFSAERG